MKATSRSPSLRLKEMIPGGIVELQGLNNSKSDLPFVSTLSSSVIRKNVALVSSSNSAIHIDNNGNHDPKINPNQLHLHGSDHNNDETKINASLLHELRVILHLSSQGIVSQLGWSVPSFLIAHHIGKNLSVVHLDGYSLAILTGNLFVLSLLEGIFSAVDTLLPQCFGARKYAEMQFIAIRCVILCLCVVVPFIIVLLFRMKHILIAVGEDSEVSEYAAAWYRVYCLSVPFYVVYYTTTCFLAAQYIVAPTVIVALFSSLILLPIMVEFLGFNFGFLGTGWAVVFYQVFQAFAIVLYLVWQKPHHPDSWSRSELTFAKIMQWKPISQLLWLSGGGMLAGSEWIYWELLSLLIGTLGVTQLTVHTISSQVVTFIYMIPLGVSEAITIRLGNVLPQSPKHAKRLSLYYFIGGACMMIIVGNCIYMFRHWIYALFTIEEEVIAGCDEIWSRVSFYISIMGLFGILKGIATALGKQWILGILVCIYLWSISLPLLFYLVVKKNEGVSVAWNCIWPANLFMVATLCVYLVVIDWGPIVDDIRQSNLELETEEEDDSEMVHLTSKYKKDQKDHESDGDDDIILTDSPRRGSKRSTEI